MHVAGDAVGDDANNENALMTSVHHRHVGKRKKFRKSGTHFKSPGGANPHIPNLLPSLGTKSSPRVCCPAATKSIACGDGGKDKNDDGYVRPRRQERDMIYGTRHQRDYGESCSIQSGGTAWEGDRMARLDASNLTAGAQQQHSFRIDIAHAAPDAARGCMPWPGRGQCSESGNGAITV